MVASSSARQRVLRLVGAAARVLELPEQQVRLSVGTDVDQGSDEAQRGTEVVCVAGEFDCLQEVFRGDLDRGVESPERRPQQLRSGRTVAAGDSGKLGSRQQHPALPVQRGGGSQHFAVEWIGQFGERLRTFPLNTQQSGFS